MIILFKRRIPDFIWSYSRYPLYSRQKKAGDTAAIGAKKRTVFRTYNLNK